MLTDAIKHLKEQLKNSLPEIVDAYKAESLREAISLLSKAETLSQDLNSDRNEINRLIARALILADNVGSLDGRFNQIQTQIQRRGYKASKAGEKN
jgi:uncharacterized protein YoxC